MILQGVKLTIQPLGVGYANRPKKAKMGGYVAFSPIYACLALFAQAEHKKTAQDLGWQY